MNAPRYNGFDWLRGIAALFIVATHLSVWTTPAWARISAFGSQTGIEVFAAMSGFLLALLLDRAEDKPVWRLIAHRARRLLPVYLAWTVFYLAALSLLDWGFGVPRGYLANFSPRFVATAVLRGAAEVHMWFVPSLFCASALLTVADRLLWAPLRNAWAWLAGGAAIGLFGSCAETNFFCHDVRLFGWVMLGMGLSRIVRSPDASALLRHARRFAAWAFLPVLAGCVLAQGTAFWFVADMAVALLVLLVLSDPAFPRSRVGSFLSRTSLGVYYSHVFVSRALSVVIRKWHPEQLDMWCSLCLWLLVWLVALALTALYGRVRRRAA